MEPEPSTSSTSQQQALPPALETLLQPLSHSRSVLGVLVLGRGASSSLAQPPRKGATSVIRAQGALFEGEKGRAYAARIGTLVGHVEEDLAGPAVTEETTAGQTVVEGAVADKVRVVCRLWTP